MLTCQLVTPAAPRPCRDVRRLPPGVTPDDVKRSKAEAAKTRAEAARDTAGGLRSDEKSSSVPRKDAADRQSNNGSKLGVKAKQAGMSISLNAAQSNVMPSGTVNSAPAGPSSAFTKKEPKASDAAAGTSKGLKIPKSDNQTPALPTAAAISSSLAATREDFKRAMSQITYASETIRQAHSLLTSMGLGHYSLRRRLAQVNNNNNPESVEENNDTTQNLQAASMMADQGCGQTKRKASEELSDTEERKAVSVCKSSACDATEEPTESIPSLPPVVIVKPINGTEEDFEEGNKIGQESDGTASLPGLKCGNGVFGCNGPGESKSVQSGRDKLNVDSPTTRSFIRSTDYFGQSSRGNMNVSANVRHFRDMCSNTDSWTRWSSHLQHQRQQNLGETSRVTRFANRFSQCPMFQRNAPLLSRTKESTNIATNAPTASAISSIGEPDKEDPRNPPTERSGPMSCGIPGSQSRTGLQHMYITGEERVDQERTRKHTITLREVKRAVDFALGSLHKSGKWTESLKGESDGTAERDIKTDDTHCQTCVEDFCQTSPIDCFTSVTVDEIGNEEKSTRTEGTNTKRVTFSQEPLFITGDHQQESSNVEGSVSEDTISDTRSSSDCLTKQESSSDSIASLEHIDSSSSKIDVQDTQNDYQNGTITRDQTLINLENYESPPLDISVNDAHGQTSLPTSPAQDLAPHTGPGTDNTIEVSTADNAAVQNKPTYFDRLKELYDNQVQVRARPDSRDDSNSTTTEGKALSVLTVCEQRMDSTQIHKGAAIPCGEGETALLEGSERRVHGDLSICATTGQTEAKDSFFNGTTPIKISDKSPGGDNGEKSLSCIDSQGEKISLDCDNAEKNQFAVGSLPSTVTDQNKKDILNRLNTNIPSLKLNLDKHKRHGPTLGTFDGDHESKLIRNGANDSVLQSDSSATADDTLTLSSSTMDQVIVFGNEEEENNGRGQHKIKLQFSLETLEGDNHMDRVAMETTKEETSGAKRECSLEKKIRATLEHSPRRFPSELGARAHSSCDDIVYPQSNFDADPSTTLSLEEPLYKPKFDARPSNASHEMESPTLSSAVEVSVSETCGPLLSPDPSEPRLNVDRSLSAGDMHSVSRPDKPFPSLHQRTRLCLANRRLVFRQTDSQFDSCGEKRRRINSSKYRRFKPLQPSIPSSEAAAAPRLRLCQTEDDLTMTRTSPALPSFKLSYQKNAMSCGNSPNSSRPPSALKWLKLSHTTKPDEVSPAQSTSAVSIIEMEEEKKPKPLIFPDPSLPNRDPFGIRESAETKATVEIDGCGYPEPQVKVKVAGGSSADSDDDSMNGAGDGLPKGPASSYFSRPRRLRFRRRRRRRRQRSGSWWVRGARWVRSKLGSLFRVCFK